MLPKSGIIYFYLFSQLENIRISLLQEALATEMNIIVSHGDLFGDRQDVEFVLHHF